MPGTRTAPTVNGTGNWVTVSVTMLDYTGDQRTVSLQVDAATTDIEIEAYVAALQAVTNATIYRVSVSTIYNSVGDSSNALEEVWENNFTNIAMLYKDAGNNSINSFIPAPINAAFIDSTDQIDPANAALAAYIAATLAMLPAGFGATSARLTHRKDVNSRVKF